MINNDTKNAIIVIEEIIRLAKKGTEYDTLLKTLCNERNEHKEKIKALNHKKYEIEHRLYQEIYELKSTHPDYVHITCRTCLGQGGFETEDGGEVCSACGGIGTEYIKKELVQ